MTAEEKAAAAKAAKEADEAAKKAARDAYRAAQAKPADAPGYPRVCEPSDRAANHPAGLRRFKVRATNHTGAGQKYVIGADEDAAKACYVAATDGLADRDPEGEALRLHVTVLPD